MTVMTGTCPAVVRQWTGTEADRAACSSGPARVQLGPRWPRRSCTALNEAIPPGRAPAVPLWPQPGPCSGGIWARAAVATRRCRPLAPSEARIRPRTGRESGARPFGPGKFAQGPRRHTGREAAARAGRAAVGGGSEELRVSARL
jgi:hypothetical protein